MPLPLLEIENFANEKFPPDPSSFRGPSLFAQECRHASLAEIDCRHTPTPTHTVPKGFLHLFMKFVCTWWHCRDFALCTRERNVLLWTVRQNEAEREIVHFCGNFALERGEIFMKVCAESFWTMFTLWVYQNRQILIGFPKIGWHSEVVMS